MKEKYDVKLEGKEWKDCLKHAFDKKKKDIKMDGFRKGQVPYDVYVKKMGIEALYMDAVDIAVDVLYAKLLKDEKTIIPVATPGIDIKNINHDEIEIEFTLVSAPKVELGKHTKLGIKKEEVVVTDSQIEHELHHLQEQFAEVKELDDDAVIKEGNVAVIDFEGFKDGKAFKGGKGEDYSLEIGSHTFIPGFEDQLVGVSAGETKDVVVTFPTQYVPELAGKEATFKCTVHEVKEKVLPEVNEELIADLQIEGVTNVEQLRENQRNTLLANKDTQAKNAQLDAIVNKIVENSTIEIADEIIKDEVAAMKENMKKSIEQRGLTFEQYLQITGKNEEDLEKELSVDAKKNISAFLCLDKVASVEGITVTKEEIEQEFEKIAQQYSMPVEQVKEILGKDLNRFASELRSRKINEFIVTNNSK